MVYKTSDKLIAYLTLVSGLTISAVAIYYSVAGLVAIFAAAVVPIIVMGVALEISKLVATVWLKLNWQRAPVFIRTYLLIAIAILMLITSMGIFGFLSKAHSDQSLVSGDVQSKIAVYDEKIKTEKENIEANRKALKQMDEGVDQVLGRSTDEKGADKAVAIRKSQQKERARLQAEISQSQKLIAELNDARAPIAAEVRKVEAEVGPIKYIANLIYGDNPDANVLEKAVTWVIMIIVSVFDPLAVILLLASQYSFQWFRQQDEEDTEDDVKEWFEKGKERARELDKEVEQDKIDEANALLAEIPKEEPTLESVGVEEKVSVNPHPIGWMYPKHADIQSYRVVEDADDEVEDIVKEVGGVEAWNKMIEEAEKAVEEEKSKFPNDPFKGQQVVIDDKGYIFNGSTWVESPLSHSTDDIERPGDYLTESDESKKKTTYIVKEENHQVRKEK